MIILPTYGARESKDEGLGGDGLARYINKNCEGALYLQDYESAREYVQNNSTARDVVVVLGAGSVNALGEMLTK